MILYATARTADPCERLGERLLGYSLSVKNMNTPGRVLDDLNAITTELLDLRVLGAARFPQNVTDWGRQRLGKEVFICGKPARDWWEAWVRLADRKVPVGYLMARCSIVPHTWTESMQMIQPLGVERWGYELALKYGMRDGFYCPVGGRWLIAFWSHRVLCNVLADTARVMIFGAASFAAMQLEHLVRLDQRGEVPDPVLTPRELAVLRQMSMGASFRETAERLALGEETIRTHLRKAQTKLGAQNRAQTIAEAIRRHYIP